MLAYPDYNCSQCSDITAIRDQKKCEWWQLGAGWRRAQFGLKPKTLGQNHTQGGSTGPAPHKPAMTNTHLSKVKRMATRASARGRAASMSWGCAKTRPSRSSSSVHELLGGSQNLSCHSHSFRLDHILWTDSPVKAETSVQNG